MASSSGDKVKPACVRGESGKGGNAIPIDPAEQLIRRFLPKFLPRNANHIYVTPGSNYKNQFARARSNLNYEGDYIIVHGMGMAAEKGINMTLQLKDSIPGLNLITQTSGFHINEDMALEVIGDRQTTYVNVVHMKLMKPVADDRNKSIKAVKEQLIS